MGGLSCIFPETTERDTVRSPRSGHGNARRRSRIREDTLIKLPVTLVVFLWASQCRVDAQAHPLTEAPPVSEIGFTPLAEVPTVQGPVQGSPSPAVEAPPRPLGQAQQFQQVITSLRASNYTIAAHYVAEFLILLPLNSTLFVPTNDAFDAVNPLPALGPLLAYHDVTEQLSYQQLLLLPMGAQLPTAVSDGVTVVVTSAAPDNFRVDDVRVVEGNVCSSATSALQITCHGVDAVLNMTLWGGVSIPEAAPSPSPVSDRPGTPKIALPPVGMSPSVPTPAPEYSPPAGAAPRTDERLYPVFSLLFLYVLAAALI